MSPVPARVEVLDPVDRWLHLGAALGGLGALATGPFLESPSLASGFGPAAGALGSLHGWCAGALLLAWALHLTRICLAWLEGRTPLGLLLRPGDLAALVRCLAWNLRVAREPPLPGRFSYRERLPYTALLLAVPVLGATGWAVSHPATAFRVLGAQGLLAAAQAHASAGVLLVPFVVWHVYFAHLQPGVLFWNGAWLTGQSPWTRVAALRPGWARELAADAAPARDRTQEAPSVESLLETGNRAAREGRLDVAEEAFLEALRLYPAYSQALFNLGVVRSRRGDRAGAADALERFLEADPFGPVSGRARTLLGELRGEPAHHE
ncbi:MAG: tetratricopeptide repeat protein [Thermodesulfobacteriota bacterium]